MSKTQTKTVTKANPKIHAPVQPQTGRSSQTTTGGEMQRPVRKAPPAVTATASRAKGRAAPATVVPAAAIPASRRPSKAASIEALLRRACGAAIADLTAATGWQQHSVRAALTGLRKQGYHLVRAMGPAGGSVYRITQEQHQAKV